MSCRYSSQEVEECEEDYEARCEITFQPELRNVSRRVCSNTTAGKTSLYSTNIPITWYIQCLTQTRPRSGEGRSAGR